LGGTALAGLRIAEICRGIRDEMQPSLKEIGDQAAAEAERQAIRVALQVTQGNKSAAARLLAPGLRQTSCREAERRVEALRHRDPGVPPA